MATGGCRCAVCLLDPHWALLSSTQCPRYTDLQGYFEQTPEHSIFYINSAVHYPPKFTQMFCFGLMQLFQGWSEAVNDTPDLNICFCEPQVGNMELCVRLVNGRDEDVQTLAKPDPASTSHYKYPAMVGQIFIFLSKLQWYKTLTSNLP